MSRSTLPINLTHAAASLIERLELRIAPAAILASVTGHTLHLTGDAGDNVISIDAVSGDATAFSITSTGDTINGSSSYSTPSGIKNIIVTLKGGADTLNLGEQGPINLLGSLTVKGGSGDNTFSANQLTLGKGLSIKNADGSDETTLIDSVFGGSVKILNGDGGSDNEIYTTSASRTATISGNLTIVNGTGEDSTYTEDTSIGGSVTVKNGRADASGNAGYTEIFNSYLTSQLSTIGGNVHVSYVDGTVDYDGIWDTKVSGNVSFQYGKADFTTYFDGYSTNLAPVIQGKLSIEGAGSGTVSVGEQYMQTGLEVGSLSVKLRHGASGNLDFNHLEVQGQTAIAIRGADTLTLDDSTFHGDFGYTTGGGGNTINIEQKTGTSVGTIFEGIVDFDFNGGGTNFAMAGASDSEQTVTSSKSIVIHKGGGGLSQNVDLDQIFFPLGQGFKVKP